ISQDWTAAWYAGSHALSDNLRQDLRIREYLKEKLKAASVSRITIERPAKSARITVHTARPGIVIGKKGEDIEKLRAELARLMGVPVHANIEEARKHALDAQLAAE